MRTAHQLLLSPLISGDEVSQRSDAMQQIQSMARRYWSPNVRKNRLIGEDLMYSRLLLSISCLSVLWLSFSGVVAKAQDGNADPIPYVDKLRLEVSNIRDQAGRGDAMAEYRLGRLYMTGTGVTSDYKEAAKYLHAADEQGLPEAKVVLGYLYENGKGVPRDYRRAFDYYAAAARQGDLTAANNLAAMYGHGRGVRRDVQQSVNWYRHAAEGGNVVAQCNLATLYFRGRGVVQDYTEAAQWFRKAAESGYPPGQESLAWMFNTGTGVARDYAIAAHWLELAAHSSYSRAQLELGYLYEQGKGVPLDYVTAYMWYKTAESGGDGRAREELKRVSRLMTKQQISQAKAAASELASSVRKGKVVEESQSIGNAFNPER
jgi:TPR repeat protein